MATYVLIHGGADGGSCWNPLAERLDRRGHQVVAPDLPSDDETANLTDQATAVVDAVGSRQDCVVVAHSLGGLVGPIVASMLDDTRLLVMLAAMIPQPGETLLEMWTATGYELPITLESDGEDLDVTSILEAEQPVGSEVTMSDASTIASFYHDVPPDLAAWAVTQLRPQAVTVFNEPWPLVAWPDIPTRYVLCRDDRMLAADWTRRLVRTRLGIEPDEIDGSHSPFLARPAELAQLLETFRSEL